MQMKNAKLQQENEHLSSVKEYLSLENQQNTNELKVLPSQQTFTFISNSDTPLLPETSANTVYVTECLCVFKMFIGVRSE